MTLRSAYLRTERSLLVNAPSLNTGWKNRLVVTIGTIMPVSSSVARKRLINRSRSPSAEPERHEVVVVEAHAIRPELGQPVHRLDRVEGRAGRVAERVARLPPDRPQAERELIFRSRGICHRPIVPPLTGGRPLSSRAGSRAEG